MGVALGAAALAGAGEFTLDDFEDGDGVSKNGLAWVGLADSLMGQGSRVRLSIVDTGAASGGRKALRVEGELADRFAGAWVATGEMTRDGGTGAGELRNDAVV